MFEVLGEPPDFLPEHNEQQDHHRKIDEPQHVRSLAEHLRPPANGVPPTQTAQSNNNNNINTRHGFCVRSGGRSSTGRDGALKTFRLAKGKPLSQVVQSTPRACGTENAPKGTRPAQKRPPKRDGCCGTSVSTLSLPLPRFAFHETTTRGSSSFNPRVGVRHTRQSVRGGHAFFRSQVAELAPWRLRRARQGRTGGSSLQTCVRKIGREYKKPLLAQRAQVACVALSGATYCLMIGRRQQKHQRKKTKMRQK